MADYAHSCTDRELLQLERRIRRMYRRVYKDLSVKINEYFEAFEDRDAEQKALVEAGKITEDQYKQWRLAQIGRGERFEAMRDEAARRIAEAGKIAASYINDTTPGIYSLNYNYTAYEIERLGYDLTEHGRMAGVSWTLYDEQAVKRLIQDDPQLLPKASVNILKSQLWSQKRITREVTSGILQGESISKIAKRLQRVTDMDAAAAMRNARTAVTGAQNAGRWESREKAEAMGIHLGERWVATKDGRTRRSHQLLDGETINHGEKFSNGLRYPGDPDGAPSEIYNCRCTVRTVEKPGIEAEPRMIRVRDEKGRNVLVQEMTYLEWEEWQRGRQNNGQ